MCVWGGLKVSYFRYVIWEGCDMGVLGTGHFWNSEGKKNTHTCPCTPVVGPGPVSQLSVGTCVSQ